MRNYFATVSLEMLEKAFKELFERNKLKVMGGYRQEEMVMEEKRGWKELYFLLRKGDKTCFLRECKREEREVATQFESVLEEIENFRKPETQLSSIVVTNHMEIFEKIIKLAVLGKY